MNTSDKSEKIKTYSVATIGHVDHGKTTLTAAITRVLSNPTLIYEEKEIVARLKKHNTFTDYQNIDKTKEERTRGITISTTCLEYYTKEKRVSHVDCPGHSDLIKNMIVGAASVDHVLLLVSGTDGVIPQTKEHILLAKQIQIPTITVVINKADILGDTEEEQFEMCEITKIEVISYLELFKWENVENVNFVFMSAKAALEGENESNIGKKAVRRIAEHIDKTKIPPRSTDLPFIIPIAETLVKTGRGNVITGTVERGKIYPESNGVIIGLQQEEIPVTIKSVEIFRKEQPFVEAGDNVGVLLKGQKGITLERGTITRGQFLAKNKSMALSQKFIVNVILLEQKSGGRLKPFSVNYQPQFFYKTANVTATIEKIYTRKEGELMEQTEAHPGGNYVIQVSIHRPLAIPVLEGKRQAVSLTVRGDNRTIALGKIEEYLD